MRSREWQRAASAAFLPIPAVSLGHVGGFGKVAVWVEQRLSFIPRGSGERAAETLGGAGIVKAAAAGTAIVVAGTALTGHIVHDITAPTAPPRHHAHSARIEPAASVARAWQDPGSVVVSVPASTAVADSTHRATVRRSSPVPPNKGDGYLALGSSSSGGSASQAPSESPSPVRATAASVGQSENAPSNEAPTQPTQTGGGTSLSYLGK
jgi:nitrate reductase NapE component